MLDRNDVFVLPESPDSDFMGSRGPESDDMVNTKEMQEQTRQQNGYETIKCGAPSHLILGRSRIQPVRPVIRSHAAARRHAIVWLLAS